MMSTKLASELLGSTFPCWGVLELASTTIPKTRFRFCGQLPLSRQIAVIQRKRDKASLHGQDQILFETKLFPDRLCVIRRETEDNVFVENVADASKFSITIDNCAVVEKPMRMSNGSIIKFACQTKASVLDVQYRLRFKERTDLREIEAHLQTELNETEVETLRELIPYIGDKTKSTNVVRAMKALGFLDVAAGSYFACGEHCVCVSDKTLSSKCKVILGLLQALDERFVEHTVLKSDTDKLVTVQTQHSTIAFSRAGTCCRHNETNEHFVIANHHGKRQGCSAIVHTHSPMAGVVSSDTAGACTVIQPNSAFSCISPAMPYRVPNSGECASLVSQSTPKRHVRFVRVTQESADYKLLRGQDFRNGLSGAPLRTATNTLLAIHDSSKKIEEKVEQVEPTVQMPGRGVLPSWIEASHGVTLCPQQRKRKHVAETARAAPKKIRASSSVASASPLLEDEVEETPLSSSSFRCMIM